MKIPKKPSMADILKSTNDELPAMQELMLVHDLMDVVLEGSAYINECTSGERVPNKESLDRYNVASMELRFLTNKYGYELPKKVLESLDG